MKNGIIEKIVISGLFIFLILAMFISLTGFKGPIQLDNTYYNFMQKVALEYQSWHISIPDIPTIPISDDLGGFVDFLVRFVNFIVTILNVVILILNKIIELILFIVALIKLLVQFKESDFSTSGDLSWWNNALHFIS